MAVFELNNAENKRTQLTEKQSKDIIQIYKKASQTAKKQAEKLKGKDVSEVRKKQYLNKLQEQLQKELDKATADLESMMYDDVKTITNKTISATTDFLKKAGINMVGIYSTVPDEVIKRIVKGSVYKGNWSLSQRIWSNVQKVHDDIRKVIAAGIAAQKSVYDIAKDIEKYVSPTAKKTWEWSKVYPNTNKKVDYSAQRLARTLSQHAYQQSLVLTTQKNPFVKGIKWNISNSGRVCPICKKRNGKIFTHGTLPLDHPNGMCYFTTVMTGNMSEIADRLADWANGKQDKLIDEYARSLTDGYGLGMEQMKLAKLTGTLIVLDNLPQVTIGAAKKAWENNSKEIAAYIAVAGKASKETKAQGLRLQEQASTNVSKHKTLYLIVDKAGETYVTSTLTLASIQDTAKKGMTVLILENSKGLDLETGVLLPKGAKYSKVEEYEKNGILYIRMKAID